MIVPGRPETVFDLVDDLARYPEWMDLVHAVESAAATDPRRPAWAVELQAQVGPFARSKRLRMERTVYEADRRVVFERAEIDGRKHATWVLAASVVPADSGVESATESELEPSVELTMTLTYGGSLWTGAVLQRVLDDHVERGAEALRALLVDRG